MTMNIQSLSARARVSHAFAETRTPSNANDPLRIAFASMDKNGDGLLTKPEIIIALRKDPKLAHLMGLPEHIRQEDGSRDQFENVFQTIDGDNNRALDWYEFRNYFTAHAEQLKAFKAEKQRSADLRAAMAGAGIVASPRQAGVPVTFSPGPPVGTMLSPRQAGAPVGIVSPRQAGPPFGTVSLSPRQAGPQVGTVTSTVPFGSVTSIVSVGTMPMGTMPMGNTPMGTMPMGTTPAGTMPERAGTAPAPAPAPVPAPTPPRYQSEPWTPAGTMPVRASTSPAPAPVPAPTPSGYQSEPAYTMGTSVRVGTQWVESEPVYTVPEVSRDESVPVWTMPGVFREESVPVYTMPGVFRKESVPVVETLPTVYIVDAPLPVQEVERVRVFEQGAAVYSTVRVMEAPAATQVFTVPPVYVAQAPRYAPFLAAPNASKKAAEKQEDEHVDDDDHNEDDEEVRVEDKVEHADSKTWVPKTKEDSQNAGNRLMIGLASFLLVIICMTPIWDAFVLLYTGSYVYACGRIVPFEILFFCACLLTFYIVSASLINSFAREEKRTEQTFFFLFTSTVTALGLGLLFFAMPLQSCASSASHELMFDCTTGPRTAPLHAYYNVLLNIRRRPDCIMMESVEDCHGYEERYPYTGFLKYMEFQYECSGFCYDRARDGDAMNVTLPLAAVFMQQSAVEGTADVEKTKLDLKEALQRRNAKKTAHQVRDAIHSSKSRGVSLLQTDGPPESHILEAEKSHEESDESGESAPWWNRHNWMSRHRWGYPVWMPHLTWPETVTKTFITKTTIIHNPIWSREPITGYGNTVQNMYITEWQNGYPPTLFTNANYKTTCEGAASRELLFTGVETGSMIYTEGTMLFMTCVLVGFLKIMSMCKPRAGHHVDYGKPVEEAKKVIL